MTSQEASTVLASQEMNATVFQRLESYPWALDTEFQSGLHAILGQHPSPEQAQRLTLRAQCFYFSRKNNVPVDFNAYQTWLAQQTISSSLPNDTPPIPTTSSSTLGTSTSVLSTPNQAARHDTNATITSSEPPAPYPSSFSQIVELITNGHPIPGIKEIPDTVLEGRASQATTTKRKKPWENENAGGGGESGITAINA